MISTKTKRLSIDNLFVFVLIMGQFSVPRRYQQEVLMVGIIIALVLRGLFILVGAAVIEHFSPIFYLFGAFLIYTAVKQAFPGGDHDSDVKQENFVLRLLRHELAADAEVAAVLAVLLRAVEVTGAGQGLPAREARKEEEGDVLLLPVALAEHLKVARPIPRDAFQARLEPRRGLLGLYA